MANIEGEARHTIDTKTPDDGPGLLINADDGNIILHALNASSQAAMIAMQKAVGSGNMQDAASAMAAGQETGRVLGLFMGVARAGEGTPHMSAGPTELGTVVNALVTYKHKLDGALAQVKNGEFKPVDVAEDATLAPDEIRLSDYNIVQLEAEAALPLAQRIASHLREWAPDVIEGSLNFFVMQAAGNRDRWIATDSGLPVGSVWDGMLSTASVLFGYEPDILDGLVQAKSGPLN